jgi:hypothetical protein
MNGLEFPYGSIENQFAEAFKIGIGVTLCAVLCRNLRFSLHVIRTDGAHFFHADTERLFAEYMHVAIQGPIRDESVVVVCRADHHSFNVLLVQQPSPIPIRLGFREELQSFLRAQVVDVADSHYIFITERVVMRSSPAPDTNKRNIQFVAGNVLASQGTALEDRESRSPAP